MGSLMYAALGTRPDTAHAVQQLSQYSSNPGPVHRSGLTYRRADTLEPFSYSNTDRAKNLDGRKSILGQVLHLAGVPITWASRKQCTITKSSMEAKYMAAVGARGRRVVPGSREPASQTRGDFNSAREGLCTLR